MKKLLLTSFVLITFIANSNAQEEYGIKAGFFNSERATNISFQNSGLKTDTNFNEGIYFGAFAEFKLSEKFGLRPEITYASVKNDFDQLRVPLLGTYKIGKKFKVFLGPEIGYLLTDNENFNNIHFGATIGVAYEIIKNLSIEARYYYAFTESLKNNYSYDSSAKFNSFQLGLVYRFGK